MKALQSFDTFMLDYLFSKRKWQEKFPSPPLVKFNEKEGYLTISYCKDCRICCIPQMKIPYRMALFENQIQPCMNDIFFMLNENCAVLDQRGCKALNQQGCSVQRNLRPLFCNIFPFVLINGKLYLHKLCPAVRLLPLQYYLHLTELITKYLSKFSETDLKHLSQYFNNDILDSLYIFMNVTFLHDVRLTS